MKKGIQSFAFGKGQKRGSRLLASTALTAAGLVAFTAPAFAVDEFETPIGETVVGGAATFERPELGQLNIHQSTDRVVIDWDSFNIGESASTEFYQPGTGSLAVNRVKAKNANATQILGSLKANGRVMVLDRNGVIFGKNSRVDVGGIIASTGDIDTSAVMGGDSKIELGNFGDGDVVNNGLISVQNAGMAAFVGKNVANNGIINAKVGKVALAAGDTKATVDLYGDGLVEFAVDGAKGKVLASNAGTINAEGGTVAISASAAKDVVDDVINMSGVVNVSSVTTKGGKIILGGGKSGTVKVSGALAASGEQGGGDIKVTGKNVNVTDTAVIVSNAGQNGDGGNTLIYGDDYAVFAGMLAARGGEVSGNGGQAEVSGGLGVGYYGYTDLSATNGEAGTLVIDPEFLTISNAGYSFDLAYAFSLGIFGSVNIEDQAIANALRNNHVKLWASNTLSVTQDIDVSTWEQKNYAFSFPFCIFGCYTGSTYGITNKDLTLAAPTINLTNDVTLGTGKLKIYDVDNSDSVLGWGIINAPASGINVDVVNLDGIIRRRSVVSGATVEAGDDQIDSQANTVNVLSDDARIQQGIWLSNDDAQGTVNVAAGTYLEAVTVPKNVNLRGANADIAGTGVRGAESIVDPASPGFYVTADNVIINGFEVTGADENGIWVDGAENVSVLNNVIHNIDGDGVLGTTADGLIVKGNKIYDIRKLPPGVFDTGSGVQVLNTIGAQIGGSAAGEANKIYDTEWDGVRVDNASDDTVVEKNDIDNVGRTGIYVGQSDSVKVLGNFITGANSRYGIDVDGGSNVTLTGNDIDNTSRDGIHMVGVTGVNLVDANYVDNTGLDGIDAENVTGLSILGNFIGTTGAANNINGDGILGTNVDGVIIQGNQITKTKSTAFDIGSGIQLLDTTGATIGGFGVGQRNTIWNTGWDGVRVENSNGGIYVVNNDIDNVYRSGVYFGQSDNTHAVSNLITTAKDRYGVHVDGGSNTTVTGNDIDDVWSRDGIKLNDVTGMNLVNGNYVDKTGLDGIDAENVTGLSILANFVGTTGAANNINGDGIIGKNVDGVIIQGNQITNTTSTAFDIGSGIQLLETTGATIGGFGLGQRNTIWKTGWDGVRVEDSDGGIYVTNNDIDNVRRSGVYFGNSHDTFAQSNLITTAKDRYGVHVDGGSNSTVTGNDIDDIWTRDGVRLNDVAGVNLVQANQIDNVYLGDGVHAVNVLGLTVDGNFIGLNGPIGGNGVFVDPSPYASITYNQIVGAGLNGIYSLTNDNATISGNEITGSGLNGILVEGGHNVTIGAYYEEEGYSNIVKDSGINGIEVDGTSGTIRIINNYVDTSGRDGANGTDGDGIQVHGIPGYESEVAAEPVEEGFTLFGLLPSLNNSYVEIISNGVYNSPEDGIDVSGVTGTVYIHNNEVKTAGYYSPFSEGTNYNGHDGIFVSNVRSLVEELCEWFPVFARAAVEPTGQYDVHIVDNDVDTTEDDGIEVIDSGRTLIQGNDIYDVGQGATYYELDGFGADGIHVRNVFANEVEDDYEGPVDISEYEYEEEGSGYEGPFSLPPVDDSSVDILGNYVNVDRETGEFIGQTADDGIQVWESGNSIIDNNHVANSGFVGDDCEVPSEEEVVYGKYSVYGEGEESSIQNMDWYGGDGIHVLMAGLRQDSKVAVLEEGPSYFSYGDSSDITNNFVDNSADDGIDADYVHYLTVDSNDVDVSGGEGIEIVGSGYGYPGEYDYEEESEKVVLLGLFETVPWGDWTAIVTNNIVNNSKKNGIKIENYDYIEASFNTVSNSRKNGLLVAGPYNGNVHVEGNVFTDNKTGAKFESGYIDLTDASNTFNNGKVGLKFAPIEYYTYIYDGEESGYWEVYGRSFLKLVDDDAPGVSPASQNPPDNFGGTIGKQIFNNQTKYFVELDNGAFFNPGTPTWLNGLNSVYTADGKTVSPSETFGLLSADDLNFLEDRFYHWVDDGSLGRFWFGALDEELPEINQQRIFNQFNPFAAVGGQVNVVLLGLPRLGGASGPAPFNPANIEPAAGGDEPQQNAAISPEELNAIQTAAGDDNASNSSCWVDASAAATGGSTTFSFSSVIDDTTLEQNSNCGNQPQ